MYCLGVAHDQVVRWDLQRNVEDGRWPAPDTYGRIALSGSGRTCIVTKHGGRGGFALDTDTGERIRPDFFHEQE